MIKFDTFLFAKKHFVLKALYICLIINLAKASRKAVSAIAQDLKTSKIGK